MKHADTLHEPRVGGVSSEKSIAGKAGAGALDSTRNSSHSGGPVPAGADRRRAWRSPGAPTKLESIGNGRESRHD
ncbi:hypothetical protein HT746_22845 [Burkholderia pyrrocinia]|uniref:hypothetical protein n=1 Tax=Burkholderia pyrrocinia TaxID=60550 RepID=UPI0015753C7D|nr:hypothetical protein [Burkholderia pyrrocinia]NTX29921.1 hypothetical protein [Burkholderia pyrrocinia]